MSTIPSPLVADWIKQGLKWKYVVKDLRDKAPFTIPPNQEKRIGQYFKTEGLFLFGIFVFDRPFGGVRIDAYPEWPETLDIPTLWSDGVIAPNIWGWITRYRPAPYTGALGTYAMCIPQGQVWQNRFELYVLNTDPTVSIRCTHYLYMMAVLEQARSPEAKERFEAEGEN